MSIKGKTANKGEWAEIYVLCRLLGEGRLYSADNHLEKIPGSYVEILKIIREEIAGAITEYRRDLEGGTVEISTRDGQSVVVAASEFEENASCFFKYLNDVSGRAVVASDKMCDFLDLVKVTKPKAPSLQSAGSFGGKSDIVINMRDSKTTLVSTMGFSIKSQFASAPTLYNAGTSTQFLFELRGMTDELMDEFNGLKKNDGNRDWQACAALYKREGMEAAFLRTENPVTSDNMLYIRESMTALMACIYKHRLLEDTSCQSLHEICRWLKERNPLSYPDTNLYEKVLKDFLFASFAGMTGGTRWDGTEQINGGYIVVKPSGEVLCYHSSDREQFRDYLLRQTYIEYVSCKKFRWGYVKRDEQGRYILPLNGSVRFCKHFVEN